MGILGIGVDIVHLTRITSTIVRRTPARFASRILSSEELLDFRLISFDDYPQQARFLAVRWAVKEATYKALYPDHKPTWKELTYKSMGRSSAASKPLLLYRPCRSVSQSEGSDVGTIQVTVSHDGEYVFASVLVEKS